MRLKSSEVEMFHPPLIYLLDRPLIRTAQFLPIVKNRPWRILFLTSGTVEWVKSGQIYSWLAQRKRKLVTHVNILFASQLRSSWKVPFENRAWQNCVQCLPQGTDLQQRKLRLFRIPCEATLSGQIHTPCLESGLWTCLRFCDYSDIWTL